MRTYLFSMIATLRQGTPAAQGEGLVVRPWPTTRPNSKRHG
jgi:hypothetical protein